MGIAAALRLGVRRVFATGIVFALAAGRVSAGSEPGGVPTPKKPDDIAATLKKADDVLSTLKKIDFVYISGFTCSGVESIPPGRLSKMSRPRDAHWRFTRKGHLRALIELDRKIEPPARDQFDVPEDAPAQKEKKEKDAKAKPAPPLSRLVPFGNVTLFDEQKSASMVKQRLFTLEQREGAVPKMGGEQDRIGYDAADSYSNALPVQRVMWIAGRGFTERLESASGVITRSDGSMVLEGQGIGVYPMRGKWNLILEPAAGYMVRRAEFVSESDAARILVENKGTRHNGDCFYPEEATFVLEVGGSPRKYAYSLETAALKFDEALFAEAVAQFAKEPPKGSFLVDDRTSPAEAVIVGVTPRMRVVSSKEYPGAVAFTPRIGTWYVFLGQVLAIIVLGMLWLMTRQRDATKVKQPENAP